VATKVGYIAVLYNASGTVIACIIFDLKAAWTNYKKTGVFWNDQNIIKNGKLSLRNLLGFLCYSAL